MEHADRVRAATYGQAIGDSLGLRAEYKSGGEVAAMYPDGGPKVFEAVDREVFGYREVWTEGQWSDDTDNFCCVIDAYLDTYDDVADAPWPVLAQAFGRRLLAWKAQNPRGMGRHTRTVLESPGYDEHPLAISEQMWAGRPSDAVPANGGVMRTAAVGLLRPWDASWTTGAAVTFCQATHFGGPCVASAVAVSVLVARLVAGERLSTALDEAETWAAPFDPEILKWTRVADLADLRLDEGLPITKGVPVLVGHTYKTMGAAFWAVQNAARLKTLRTSGRERFRKCLEAIIMAGGDTDTNGAVTGAVLGAYEGMGGIPDVLAQGLDPREELDRRILRLLATHE